MAENDPTHAAGLCLEQAVCDLVTIVRVCDSINPDHPPEWLAMLFGRVLDIDRLTQEYMGAVHAERVARSVGRKA